jgi:hypothetical protein
MAGPSVTVYSTFPKGPVSFSTLTTNPASVAVTEVILPAKSVNFSPRTFIKGEFYQLGYT